MQKSKTFDRLQCAYPQNAQQEKHYSLQQFFKKTVLSVSIAASLCLQGLRSEAQTIQFTSTPATSAVEDVNYVTSLSALVSTNDPITYSAQTLPAWLTLNSSGASANGTRINNTIISGACGVARDADGIYYVVQRGAPYGIYKVMPDGTTNLWVTGSNWNNFGAIVVDNFLYVSNYSYGFGIIKYDITKTNPAPVTVYNTGGVLSMTHKDGYLYAACFDQSKIIKIKLSDNSATDYLTGVSNCFGLGFDPSGNLLVARYSLNKVTKFVNGIGTDVITGLPAWATDVKIDAQGYIYISFYTPAAKIRRYKPDYSSFTEVSENAVVWGMTMTPGGTLIYANTSDNNVYSLQTGITLSGKPSHSDVGQHPVKIRATSGAVSVDQEFVITVTDPNPPTVDQYSPANTATEVEQETSLSLDFNETIVKGSGNIYIKSSITDEVLQTIDVNSSDVSVSDKKLSLAVSGLPVYTKVYITIDEGAVKDVNDNDFAGIGNSTTWAFTTIAKSPQAITFASSNEVVYGQADYSPDATSDAGLDITYTSSDESIAVITDGKVHIKKAGTVFITASQAGNDDFLAAVPAEQKLVIAKKEITVNVAETPAISKIYDGKQSVVVAAGNYVISGVINNEDVQIKGTALFSDANAGTDKTITVNEFVVSGENKDNYRLATELATTKGSIGKKQISLTLNVSPAISKTYDGGAAAALAASNYALSDILENDVVAVTGTATYSDKNAGTGKIITVNAFVLNGAAKNNYTLTTTTATVQGTILKKDITIVAHAKTKVYGAADPQFTYDVTGLVNGDQMSGSLGRAENKNVGEYALSIGTLTAGANYNVSKYTDASLVITPAPLTITAEDKTKEQGKANPALTFKYDGLVAGDSPADLTSQPQAQTSAVVLSPIGYYDIIASGAASSNYTITMANGKLSVLPSGNTHVKVWSSSASQLQIRVYAETAQKGTLVLYTQSGQALVQEPKQLQAGINSFTMSVGSFASGVYILNVYADKFKEAQRVKIK